MQYGADTQMFEHRGREPVRRGVSAENALLVDAILMAYFEGYKSFKSFLGCSIIC